MDNIVKLTAQRNNKRPLANWICLLLVCLLPLATVAEPSSEARSMQTGFMLGSADPIDSKDFTIGEVYVQWLYPPFYETSLGWTMDFRWHASVGALSDDNDTAALISGGFQIGTSTPKGLARLHVGTRPTLLSEYDFDERNLGGEFHFISHAGLSFRLAERLHAGARIQHLSNASFYDRNPGLDTVVLDVGWTF